MGALAASATQRAVATAFSITRFAVQATLDRFKNYNTFESQPRSGRPPAHSYREKRQLIRLTKKDPQIRRSQLEKAPQQSVESIRGGWSDYHVSLPRTSACLHAPTELLSASQIWTFPSFALGWRRMRLQS